MQFQILNRWSGEVKFTAEIDCAEDAPSSLKIGLAVKWAVKSYADLRYANLSSADLRSANLRSADLSYADLRSANLSSADLRSADLSSADLRYADLSYADLSYANLRSADLRSADLRYADLRSADLRYADLSYADLSSAKNDLWDVLLRAQPEVPALLSTLRAGKIDGSTYQGDCACLAGTIANVRGVDYEALGFADSNRPIERWFLNIREGDTPETSAVAKITEGWILEFQALIASPAA